MNRTLTLLNRLLKKNHQCLNVFKPTYTYINIYGCMYVSVCVCEGKEIKLMQALIHKNALNVLTAFLLLKLLNKKKKNMMNDVEED